MVSIHRFFLFICAGALLTILIAGCTRDNVITIQAEPIDANRYSTVYEGIKHDFSVYLPEERDEETPLIIMLPGYGQGAESFRSYTRMDEDANRRGYAVVYVTGAADPEDRTSSIGWNSGLRDSRKDDVGFLKALARYVQREYQLSEEQTFVVGFSNGAFMTHRLAMEASDTFRAVVSVAGMMPEQVWKGRSKNAEVGVLQINGTKDDVVPLKLNGTDRYARAPAMESVIAYWASANGLGIMEKDKLSDRTEVTKYTAADKQHAVWYVVITDGYHSWPEEQYAGFRTNELILDFLDRHK